MKICVIGAGGAGLSSARHSLLCGHEVQVFEQSGHVGGTWNYTEQVGHDKNGLPIHTSMYKGLKTNLPKELMAFEDCPYPAEQEESFIGQDQVLEYFNKYADHFELRKHIKFFTEVVRVHPSGNIWQVTIRDAKSGIENDHFFDAVVVCNGHYRVPFIPSFPGTFSGRISHSHDYRTPDPFSGKKVLLVGLGPSGIDISQQISTKAARVFLSHREKKNDSIPETITQKCCIKRLDGDCVIFEDDTEEIIDEILLCTGYLYSFPFLTDHCGITVRDRYVENLHKQVINIANPTMAFIGLPFSVCPMPMFEIQIRFFLASVSGHYRLPSKKRLESDLHEEERRRKEERGPKSNKWHQLGGGEEQAAYFDDLANTANIRPVPRVISELFARVRMGRKPTDGYRILDDHNWIQIR